MIQTDVVFQNAFVTAPTTRGVGDGVVDWKVPTELPYFDGHFPGQPILPAIAILDASSQLMSQVLGRPGLKIRIVHQAKFLSPIEPGLNVRISWKQGMDDQCHLIWSESGSGRELAKVHIEF